MTRPRIFAALLLATALAPARGAAQRVADSIPGFAAPSVAGERTREARFLAVPTAESAGSTVRRLARRPHLAGTPGGKAVADTLAAWMRGLGFRVTTERFDVYLPHPVRVRVALTAPERVELDVRERGPESGSDAPLLQDWNAYGANGRVEAPVVYASYGTADDYRALERLGVEVRGRIVLARYGRGFRGVKVAEAEARGAVGVLIFSDPSADGYAAGDTLPGGPFRPSWAVQRGTVSYLWRYTGDPLTPGAPSLPGVPRLRPERADDLPRIPVVPLPYGEALRVLRALGGPEGPAGFRGALPLPYRVGPGAARVRMESAQSYAVRPVYDVIARIPGRTDEEVIVGNHHDAWLLGGADPHSGTSALVEVARGLAALRRTGWTPRRGITLAFWDAEEFGAVGSTEWVEAHAARLRAGTVAYLNVDMFTAGTLDVSGSPSLRDLVLGAAEAVPDPVTGRTVAVEWRTRQKRDAPLLGELGAGSDWTAFFHRAGIPSLQWTSNGRGAYTVYHSVLDDAEYAGRWADPGFRHAPMMAGVMGIATLRLADADALPFRYGHYADRVEAYLAALERRTTAPLPADAAARIRGALAALRGAALAAGSAQARALAAGDTLALARMDAVLPRVEGAFLDRAGMPGRPWYRHTLYAPGVDSGYDPVALPGIAEALAGGDGEGMRRETERLERALRRAAMLLRSAAPSTLLTR